MTTETVNAAGRGKKVCPQCKIYVGVRTQACASCGHVFAAKAQKTEVVVPPSKIGTVDQVVATLALIERVRTFVVNHGGADKAVNVLAEVEELLAKTGGLATVRAVITATFPKPPEPEQPKVEQAKPEPAAPPPVEEKPAPTPAPAPKRGKKTDEVAAA